METTSSVLEAAAQAGPGPNISGTSAAAAAAAPADATQLPPIQFTIQFQPGPLGMNLEPNTSEESADGSGKKEVGCRVMNFANNSAFRKSQARELCVRHRDILVKVGDTDITGMPFHDIIAMLQRKDVDGSGGAVGKSITLRRCPQVPKKRGRPKGSKNNSPRKKRKVAEKVEKPPEWKSNRDKNKFLAAQRIIGSKAKSIEDANEKMAAYEREIANLQKRIETTKKTVETAKKDLRLITAAKASDLALEPNEWNEKYEQLLAYKEKHGDVSHLSKRKGAVGLSKEDIVIHNRMAKFLSSSRTAKKAGTLDLYKEVLLDRVGINWNPPQGPTGEKWRRHFDALVEFKRVHGHLDIPRPYPPHPRLADWLKKQKSYYNVKQDGKPHQLSDGREKLLSDLGVEWPPKRVTTSWETRYQELLNYRRQCGHVNVPWRWKTNRPLAAWVNAQRKKYMDIRKGRKSNLTQDNIRLLDEIGFRWQGQTNKSHAKSADDSEAAAAAASTYQADEMTTEEAQGLLALSEYPDFESNI
mmetsp:Transcript_2145/g.6204  ORF Transcript_2145/g.6204 Transcript_2145/m.6204 type:complete len:528 (-) Transcript_2145:1233-2816(-)